MSVPAFAEWGLVALDQFEQLDFHQQQEAVVYGERLKALSDTELFAESKDRIWAVAIMESQGRFASASSYALVADLLCGMCCTESNRRAPEGVAPYSAEAIYARAHKACMAEAGV